MLNKKLNILFDLDGTLICQSETICKCINYALKNLGFNTKSNEIINKTIGACIFKVFDNWVGSKNTLQAYKLFQKKYTDILYQDVKKMPGVDWIISKLYADNNQLIIFTGKDGQHARNICQYLNIDKYFTHIIGSNDSSYRKPEIGFTQFVINKFSLSIDNTILIGDTIYDSQSVKAFKIPCYLVTTGSNTKEELIKNNISSNFIFKNLYDLGTEVFGFNL